MSISQSVNQDALGSQTIAGEGTAGTPSGGVLTVQGVTNGSPVTVQNPLDSLQSVINITTQDLATTTTSGFAGQLLITGTPTAGSAATYTVSSIQTAAVLISGTWTGTLNTEVSEDNGTTWEPRSIHVIGTSTFASAITGNVAGSMNLAAKSGVRVRASSPITGTAVVKIVLSDNPSNFYIANSLKIVDGSSTPAVNTLTIKAASTAALTTDMAAVVAISPNNITQINQQLSTRDVIDISSQFRAQSVTTTAAEALGAGTILANRKVLVITPINGTIYWGGSGVTSTTGSPIVAGQSLSLAVTANIHIFIVGLTTTDVRIFEGG